MKIGPLIMAPLLMWMMTDLIVPSALSATLINTQLTFSDVYGPVLGAVMSIIANLLGISPSQSAEVLLWSPLIFSALLGLFIPLFVFLGLRFSGQILGSGVSISLADETVHTLYSFTIFFSLYVIFAGPAYLYLQIAQFPLATLFFIATTVLYTIGAFGSFLRGA